MAIFKKNEAQVQKPRERPAASSRGQGDSAISIIGAGMKVVGDIVTEGIVRVEGQVEGTIRAGTAVVLGQAGSIEGNLFTEDAVIGGRVSGSIVASNRLELQSTCRVDGEIRTRAEHLKLEEGARFAGQVHMIEDAPAQPIAQLTPGSSGSEAYAVAGGNGSPTLESSEVDERAPGAGEDSGAEDADGSDAKQRQKAEAR